LNIVTQPVVAEKLRGLDSALAHLCQQRSRNWAPTKPARQFMAYRVGRNRESPTYIPRQRVVAEMLPRPSQILYRLIEVPSRG
jgi:hypothetical protein